MKLKQKRNNKAGEGVLVIYKQTKSEPAEFNEGICEEGQIKENYSS